MNAAVNPAANPLGLSMNEMFASVKKAAPTEVDIDVIDVAPQVRKEFEDDNNKLSDMAETIKSHGVIQPVLLRVRPGGRYELVAGERRLRAAKLAGLTKIPCVIRTLTDEQAIEAQFIENIHRKNLTQLEEAGNLKKMLAGVNGDRAALAKKVQKSAAWIAQMLNLLDLSPQARRLIDEGISSDVTAINNVRQIEKTNPVQAKALVDQAAAKPGVTDLRKKTGEAKKENKVHTLPGKSPAPVKPSGPAPSTATPRDRSMEEPGTPSVMGGGSIFPTAPMKPHEKAITALVDASKKSGAVAVTIVNSVAPSDLELVAKHGKTFFDRGQATEDLAPALIAGLARNEFGKGPVELFNLTAFLQGHGKAETFEVDKAIAKIISAT
ncbi:ParB/RepB/Spo0J family partition protein [Variovorax sp. J22P271]|uniref:ParB/RepB/Spo0J family partition protein n=1 Tax=Variovorax davisae TaxID=3053515 RepID=UPI0025788F78|nr:ParB/RepB/Spo0J family partition protein [Variovorax sp. J22P271]MDM0036731.1 ParB/RepB/Spo0J family partition protein [Variovorax sp. J22P271]